MTTATHGRVSAGATVRPVMGNLTDQAKRYRAHHPDVEPGPPKRCGFCGSSKNVVPHHITGNEDHGEAQDLMWACKSCNGLVGNLMRKHGIGKLTRQYNPVRKGSRKQLMAEYDAAIKVMRGTFEGDVAKAVRTIHSTPREIRSAYTARSWPVRRQLYGASGRQGELFENPTPSWPGASQAYDKIARFLDWYGKQQGYKKKRGGYSITSEHEDMIRELNKGDEETIKARLMWIRSYYPQFKLDATRGNPATASAEMYESFHGFPSEETVEFTERTHHHDHLAALGVLIGLKVRTVSGYDVVLSFVDEKKQNPSIKQYLSGLRSHTHRFIPYKRLKTETDAYKLQASLERRGVGSRVDRVRVKLIPLRHEYEVLVDPGQFREHLRRHKANPAKHPLGDDPKWALEWEKKRRETEKKNEALRKSVKGKPNGKGGQHGPFTSTADFVDSATGLIAGPGRKILKATTGALDKGVRAVGKKLNPQGFQVWSYSSSDGRGPIPEKLLFGGKVFDSKSAADRAWYDTAPGRNDHHVVIRHDSPRKLNPSPGALCLLSSNEAGTQLFINGGDQSLDLKSMKIEGHEADKESVLVGEAWLIAYRTAKDYGDGDDATVDWVHAMGPEKQAAKTPRGGDLWEDANPPETLFGTGELPTVVYRRLDKRIELVGGIYHIEKPFMETSAGIEG